MMAHRGSRMADCRAGGLAAALLAGVWLACTTGPASAAKPPDVGATRGVFLSEARLETLRARIARRVEPTYTAWVKLKARADKHLAAKPNPPERWHVPGYYRDAKGHGDAKRGLMLDACRSYELALAYRMTGRETYAAAAARLIDAWPAGVKQWSRKDDSTLSFSYHFPPMIFAADLIAPSPGWPIERQRVFRRWVREKAIPMNCMQGRNNWGNWGLCMAISAARYVGDDALFCRCAARWKQFIESQIAPDGHLHHEVRRSGGQRGLWYSHFSLFPQTVAAEVARLGGEDLYEYRSPSGRTLRQAFERIASWVRRPGTFPFWKGDPTQLHGAENYQYFELLGARWPNADATALLRARRPMTALFGAPALTFTHGGLLRDDGGAPGRQ